MKKTIKIMVNNYFFRGLNMKIDYNSEKLYQLISDFHKISGISITMLGKDRQRVTNNVVELRKFCCAVQREHSALCKASDTKLIEQCTKTRKPAIHVCHAGLIDAAIPVIVEDEIVGYISMGQIRRDLNFSEVSKFLPEELLPELEDLYENMPICNFEQMESAVRIVEAVISKIVEENMIQIKAEELSKLAEKYIDENLQGRLSVETLCRHLNVSKNRLYECFHTYFNSTVNEYITQKRVLRAMEMLKNSKLTVEDIAKEVGFTDTSYFYKVFKNQTNKTPKSWKDKN